jgi:hypothetical protein
MAPCDTGTEATRFGVDGFLAPTRGRPAANPGLYEGTALPFSDGFSSRLAAGAYPGRPAANPGLYEGTALSFSDGFGSRLAAGTYPGQACGHPGL